MGNTTHKVCISAGEHGSVSPEGTIEVERGSDVHINASPDEGWKVEDWYQDGQNWGCDANKYRINGISRDTTVTVCFERLKFSVITTPQKGGESSDGSLMPWSSTDKGPLWYEYGESVTFSARPSRGYQVNQWKLDGQPVQKGGDTFPLENIRDNHFLMVDFTPKFSPVTVSISGTPIPDLWAKVISYPSYLNRRFRVPVYTMTLEGERGESFTYEVLRFGVRLDDGEPDSAVRVQGLEKSYSNHILTEWDPSYLAGSWVIDRLSEGRAMIHMGIALNDGTANLGCIAVMCRTDDQNPYREFLTNLLQLTGASSQEEIAEEKLIHFKCERAAKPRLMDW